MDPAGVAVLAGAALSLISAGGLLVKLRGELRKTRADTAEVYAEAAAALATASTTMLAPLTVSADVLRKSVVGLQNEVVDLRHQLSVMTTEAQHARAMLAYAQKEFEMARAICVAEIKAQRDAREAEHAEYRREIELIRAELCEPREHGPDETGQQA